jgi:hypothetical protein
VSRVFSRYFATSSLGHFVIGALFPKLAVIHIFTTSREVREAKDEKAILHADPADLKDPHKIKWRLSHAVGEFCGVQIFRSRYQTGLKCIGMPSDVQFAVWLLESLADFVFAELYAHLIGCLAPQSERRVIMRSFVEAACQRISERLYELIERSKKARTGNGRELVVIKDAAIKAFMKEHNMRLRTVCANQSSTFDEAARAAGLAAGDRANFGRPVSGEGGVLRLTRLT